MGKREVEAEAKMSEAERDFTVTLFLISLQMRSLAAARNDALISAHQKTLDRGRAAELAAQKENEKEQKILEDVRRQRREVKISRSFLTLLPFKGKAEVESTGGGSEGKI